MPIWAQRPLPLQARPPPLASLGVRAKAGAAAHARTYKGPRRRAPLCPSRDAA
jgi:hypothetical protein